MIEKRFTIALATLIGIVLACGCATLPTDFDKPTSCAFTDTRDTVLGRYVASQKRDNPEPSGFLLLANGLDAFVARAVLAEHAQRGIDAQYYLYHNDLVGWLFSYFLLRAADRGVRVRLLVDDMDLFGRDKIAVALDNHPNIEVRIFNPFSRNVGRASQFVTRPGSVTRRMHCKSFTVDGQITILGGRNIGDEYFDANPDVAFADLDVIGIGPVAQSVSSVFDKYWNSELAYPVSVLYTGEPLSPEEIDVYRNDLEAFAASPQVSEYMKALQASELAEDLRNHQVDFHWGTAEVVFDQPEKLLHGFEETQFQLSPKLKPYWEGVKKELIIFSPYFVPGKEGTAILTKLAHKGVRVRILTNSLASNDVALVHAGYKKYRKELLRGGVELYELNKSSTWEQLNSKRGLGGSSKASLHAKSFVFDRRQVFIGSLNLDPMAFKHNTEIGVILKVPEIAEHMAEQFDKHIEENAFRLELKTSEDGSETLVWHGVKDGKPAVYNQEPYAGFWRRLGVEIMSWLPIDSQL